MPSCLPAFLPFRAQRGVVDRGPRSEPQQRRNASAFLVPKLHLGTHLSWDRSAVLPSLPFSLVPKRELGNAGKLRQSSVEDAGKTEGQSAPSLVAMTTDEHVAISRPTGSQKRIVRVILADWSSLTCTSEIMDL
jgi:hypothetical protein